MNSTSRAWLRQQLKQETQRTDKSISAPKAKPGTDAPDYQRSICDYLSQLERRAVGGKAKA